MEQNLISQYSSARNYRPKGLDKERILQVVLLLAICMWLLYLINDSHHRQGGDDESIPLMNLTTTLGRKGLLEYMYVFKAETRGKNTLGELESVENEEGYENDVNIDEDPDQSVSKPEEETRVLNGKREATEAEFSSKQVYNISAVNIANQYSEMDIVDDNGRDVLRVEAFSDENGIPPDAEESTEPRGTEPKDLDTTINDRSNLIGHTR
ncbi:hypothetical protein M5689_021746 [Euphorbia peplus]|nr:hypothetical protein M5689_021746 [Euphorbia peplus]